jgi:hypothetical protein
MTKSFVTIAGLRYINRYSIDANEGACPRSIEVESLNDSLKSRSKSASNCTLVADLAVHFSGFMRMCLQRIELRSKNSFSLSCKLKDKLVSSMMFVKKNAKFLRKQSAMATQEWSHISII